MLPGAGGVEGMAQANFVQVCAHHVLAMARIAVAPGIESTLGCALTRSDVLPLGGSRIALRRDSTAKGAAVEARVVEVVVGRHVLAVQLSSFVEWSIKCDGWYGGHVLDCGAL